MPNRYEEIKLSFPKEEVIVRLLPFKIKETKDYVLLDTGCVLFLLRRLPSLLHKLERNKIRIGAIEHTLNEVLEHLLKSFDSKIKENVSTTGVLTGLRNFRKFLADDRIKKFANPKVSVPKETIKKYREDSLLVCALDEGSFNAIATQNGPLKRKLPGKKKISCQKLLK